MKAPTYIIGTVQTKAYGILRENVYDVLSKYGITTSLWFMLGIILEARDGIRQADVARSMNVKPPLITVMVRQMEKRGLIESVKNQFDARAKLLNVTTEGKKFIKNIDQELNKELRKLLTGLTDDELLTYHKVLMTIVSNGS